MNTSTIEVHSCPSWLKEPFTFNIWPIQDNNPYILNPKPHTVHFYEIIWLFEGNGHRVVDFEKISIQPNRVFFMYPGTVHLWEKPKDLKGLFMVISEEFLLYSLRNTQPHLLPFFTLINNIPYVDIPNDKTFFSLLELIQEEYNKPSYQDISQQNNIISSYLKTLLLKLYDCIDPVLTHTPPSKILYKFNINLNQFFRTHKRVEDYAKLVHLTPNYLNDLIRKETGKSAGWWIRKKILQEIKQQLIFNTKPIKEIAENLNYSDISYFCRFFKQHTNLTPLQFRQYYQNHNQ